MRIALLALHFSEYASRLAVALSARHDVLLVLRADNARDELTPELRRQVQSSVHLQYVEGRRWRDPRLFGASLFVRRFLRAFRPDVVHSQEVHPLLVGPAILSIRGRVPLVLTIHDPVSHSGGPPRSLLFWKSLKWVRDQADRLIVHGPRMRDELTRQSVHMQGRVDVVPHGLLGVAAQSETLYPHEPGAFLFFGRVEPYKGLEYVLDASDILARQGLAFRLIVAGRGTDLERNRARISAAPYVELIDRYIPADEVATLFRRASAVVLPYTDATQSGVAAIALANSRPVVATAVGDLPDMVIDGRTGLVVPPRDGPALARAMATLLTERAVRDALAEGAGRFAREYLCWSRVADLTEQVYVRAGVSPQRMSSPGVRATRSPPVEAELDDVRRKTGSY